MYDGSEDIISAGKAIVSGGNILGRWSHNFENESNMTLA